MKKQTSRTAAGSVDAASEWSAPTTGMTLGLLLFVTDWSITLAPGRCTSPLFLF